MTVNTTKLLALVDQFKELKRIDFDDREHRVFLKDLILAVKAAAPEIRALLVDAKLRTHPLYSRYSRSIGASASDVGGDLQNPPEYQEALQLVRKAAALIKPRPAPQTPRSAKRSAKALPPGEANNPA